MKAGGIGCNGEKLTPDPNAKFYNMGAEAMYELARQQPDFRVTHECAPGLPCQMVETATRKPDRDGVTLKDTFLTYEDNSARKVWCAQNLSDLYQLCFDATTNDGKSWVEAYFPGRHHWDRIEMRYPPCNDQQQSKYTIDNAYVSCVVAKFDTLSMGPTAAQPTSSPDNSCKMLDGTPCNAVHADPVAIEPAPIPAPALVPEPPPAPVDCSSAAQRVYDSPAEAAAARAQCEGDMRGVKPTHPPKIRTYRAQIPAAGPTHHGRQ
jgi:hypothetical protein